MTPVEAAESEGGRRRLCVGGDGVDSDVDDDDGYDDE